MTEPDFRALHYLADHNASAFHKDRYYTYAGLTHLLQTWQSHYPDLLAISTIGTSSEGRTIPLAILTNQTTGPHDTKPAYYIDAEIHAAEVTGSSVALGTIDHLLSGYGADPVITDLLDHTTLYVVPRIAVDAVETFLLTTKDARSSYVGVTDPTSGLIPSDLNGDGLVSSMRFKDPGGPWKISELDDRVMIRREPNEYGGEYYVVIPEGEIANWNGGPINLARSAFSTGLDFNRNFPHWWQPAWKQPGSGQYPLAQPEPKAVADFVLAHPNIHGSLHHHTSIGCILRPSATYPDSEMPPLDLRAYQTIGGIVADLTGYPLINIFSENPISPGKPGYGISFDWMFDQAGVFALATELWSFVHTVGLTPTPLAEQIFNRSEADDIAILRYFDEHTNGRGFTPWTTFDHPQLGPVEIGGWERKFGLMNPPGPLLPAEIDRLIPATLAAMGTPARLRIIGSGAEHLDDNLWRVWLNIANDGFLPTYGSETWRKTGNAKPVTATIHLPDDVSLLDPATASRDLGHLPGRVSDYASFRHDGDYSHLSRAHTEWFVRAPAGTQLTATITTPRAGTKTTTINLA